MNLPRLHRLPGSISRYPNEEQTDSAESEFTDDSRFPPLIGEDSVRSPLDSDSKLPQKLQIVNTSPFAVSKIKTLLIEPRPSAGKEISYLLTSLGYEVAAVASLNEALTLLKIEKFDILLSEVSLPDGNCIDKLPYFCKNWPQMPVALYSEDPNPNLARKALSQGASDFIVPPYTIGSLNVIVERNLTRNTLQTRLALKQEIALEKNHENLLEALMGALTMRDVETEGHSERVTAYTMGIANRLNIRDEDLYHIERGALLHDIGKIGIPDRILHKPGILTDEEWVEMRQHPNIGFKMCQNIKLPEESARIVLHHHEGWNGSGYPLGLRKEEIPFGARIFALADTLDAMTTRRPYREALSVSAAYEEISRCSGTQFDPEIVSVFLSIPQNHWQITQENSCTDSIASAI